MQKNEKEFISSSSIKIISRTNSISSLDTFASSAKSDDSLFEIWENRKLSDETQKPTLTSNIPIKNLHILIESGNKQLIYRYLKHRM